MENKLYIVTLTKEELALLWVIIKQMNIPGSVAEVYIGLKAKLQESMKELQETKEDAL